MKEKKALVVVSFGTTYKDTREKTIEACENAIKQDFEDYDFFRAWTSKMIINKLKNRDNEEIMYPYEALEKIHAMGYREVLIQSLHLICGEEYEKLISIVREFKDCFKHISVGRPLITNIEDYGFMTNLVEEVAKKDIGNEKNSASVWMGHGTEHTIHPVYAALDYRMRRNEIPAYIGTVEGYPEIEDIVYFLKKDGIKKVHLRPMLLVAGDHARNDMAGEDEDSWLNILRKNGFDVEVHMQGLGEMKSVQNRFRENAAEAAEI